MKKPIAFLTALLLSVGSFTACSGEAATDVEETSATVESVETTSVETTTAAVTEEEDEVYAEYMEVEGESVELKNASFEEATTANQPMSWGLYGSEYHTIDTEKANSGSNSLKITLEESGKSPWCNVIVSGLEPGAFYEVSCFMNANFTDDGRGAGIKVEQYSKGGISAATVIRGYDKSFYMKQSTNDRWNEFKGVFQAGPDVANILIYARLFSTGTVWFDDFSLKKIGAPQPYSQYIDHVFHYPDEENGNSYIRLDSYYAHDSEEATSVIGAFKIMDGDKVVYEQTDIPMTDGEICLTYPVSALSEKEKQYKAVTTLHTKSDGEQIRKWRSNLYVYDRPEYMNADGTFNIEGEPFYPVFAYHSYSGSYPYLAEAGLNCPQIAYSNAVYVNESQREKTLDECEEYGLKALFCLYIDMKHAAHPDNYINTKLIVEKYKDDPRIFAWALSDEPCGGGIKEDTLAYMETAYKLIRSIDKKHPIYYVDYGNFDETIKYCDIFVADIYAQGTTAASVSPVLEQMNNDHSRIDTFELASTYQDANDKFPSMRTVRGSVLRGLEAGGTNGTGYYSISDAFGQYKGQEKRALYEDAIWSDFATFNSVELPLLFELFNEDGAELINTQKTGEKGRELQWYLWKKGDELYVLAHNRGTSGSAKIEIPLATADKAVTAGKYVATPIGLTKAGDIEGESTLEVTLEYEDAALYKITTETEF